MKLLEGLKWFALGFMIFAGIAYCSDPANAYEETALVGAIGYITKYSARGSVDYLVIYADGSACEYRNIPDPEALRERMAIQCDDSYLSFFPEEQHHEVTEVIMTMALINNLTGEVLCLGEACGDTSEEVEG